ncbi:MAG: sigma-70 family RNA polymerase sigma factor [Planctomycetota bacterium]|nr:sigma-70 family RNA polymerase sigma factor [Planctomycetota bacterium]
MPPPMDDDDLSSPDLADCLSRLAAGDLTARDGILELCSGRLRVLAHRMLRRFPAVRRWDDTDDVFQNSALRLHRALAEVSVTSARSVMALAATQLHRELIDLARHHAGPQSYAANHATNVVPRESSPSHNARFIDLASSSDPLLERWTRFHEAIAALPEEERELFHLVWYVGADQKTIAGLLECSPRTVKSRWRIAREKVRAALNGISPE